MNNTKVIVMDVDGTLSTNNRTISKKTKDALMKCQELGIILVLASGRPTNGLIELANELEMDKYNGLLVSYNGSKVVDYTTKEVLFNETLSIEEAKKILNHIKKFNITPMIDDGVNMYVEDLKGPYVEYESEGGNFILKQVDDLENFINFEPNKILTSGEPEYLKEIFNEMKEPFNNDINCVFTASFYVEYTANGIDKAKAIDSVLKPLGYKRDEIIAFGDGHNDASMLAYAGLGIAMENAVEDLKEVADFVTLSNEEDGIAYALNKFIKDLNIDNSYSYN